MGTIIEVSCSLGLVFWLIAVFWMLFFFVSRKKEKKDFILFQAIFSLGKNLSLFLSIVVGFTFFSALFLLGGLTILSPFLFFKDFFAFLF